jgi:small-conductance mechanosensitive channel
MRCLLGLLLVLVGSVVVSAPVQAQAERATVRLDGRAVLRLGPSADADALTRASRVEQRLAAILQVPGAIPPARVEVSAQNPDERIVTVAGAHVVTVTPTDAADNLTTVDLLAAQWAEAINVALRDASERRQTPGGRFVAEVRGAVENAVIGTAESLLQIVPRALAALLVLGGFWLAARGVRWLANLLACRFTNDPTVQNLVKQVSYYMVWALGLFVAVDAFGIEPQTLVAGLGLTGIALGFALRDIISNFVSGLLILTLRPFQIGDQIIVSETEGTVERIELRATQIRTYDGRWVLVPNADVFTSRVTNNTASPMRRADIPLYVGYDADLDMVLRVAADTVRSIDGVLAQPPVAVLARELGPEGIRLEVRFWTDSRRADFLATLSAVQRALVSRLKTAGVALPEPHVRVLRTDEGQPSLQARERAG